MAIFPRNWVTEGDEGLRKLAHGAIALAQSEQLRLVKIPEVGVSVIFDPKRVFTLSGSLGCFQLNVHRGSTTEDPMIFWRQSAQEATELFRQSVFDNISAGFICEAKPFQFVNMLMLLGFMEAATFDFNTREVRLGPQGGPLYSLGVGVPNHEIEKCGFDAEFLEYGQHYPSKEATHSRIRSARMSALVLDRVGGGYESWVHGRMIGNNTNQIKSGHFFDDYREVCYRFGDHTAQLTFPDLTGFQFSQLQSESSPEKVTNRSEGCVLGMLLTLVGRLLLRSKRIN